MTSESTIGFAQAAKALGVSISTLRQAIRSGKLPAPGSSVTAVSALTPEWLASAKQAATASPKMFKDRKPQKVPAFARYKGTSAWRKFHRRVHAFNLARAEAG